MNQILLIAVGILLYLFLYYAVGTLVTKLIPAADFSIARTFLLGFFSYFFLFSLVALPMKVLLLPLSLLAHVWLAVLILIVFLFFFSVRRQFHDILRFWKDLFSGNRKYLSMIFI